MSEDTASHELILQIQRGDVSALGELYDRHVTVVYALAYRILRNHADAEEVVQDTFLQVWTQAWSFDDSRSRAEGWLLMMTRSRAIDRLRRTYRRARWETELRSHGGEPPAPLDGAGDQALIREENGKGVRRQIDTLPASQRIPLELAFYQGLTHNEIAALLCQPLGTIKTRIRLALHRMRDGLNGGSVGVPVHEPTPFTEALAEYLARHPLLRRTYANLSGVQVLVIDDDADTVDMTSMVLQSAGACVVTARSTSEALSRLKTAWADVTLADIAMPHDDGYAFIHRARGLADALGKTLTAAAFTALGRSHQEQALGAGFLAVIAKPAQPHKLLEVVACLARRAA